MKTVAYRFVNEDMGTHWHSITEFFWEHLPVYSR